MITYPITYWTPLLDAYGYEVLTERSPFLGLLRSYMRMPLHHSCYRRCLRTFTSYIYICSIQHKATGARFWPLIVCVSFLYLLYGYGRVYA